MFQYQTLACLQEIPVLRSSTNALQSVYAKAKDTSALIRVPCNFAEFVADKSLRIAASVANPLVKPLSGSVRVIDDYAAQTIRQIESIYPAITTPTEDVVNTFNMKAEPVRHAINSVKNTTTSTLQHGKDTVSNVASATVNKATGVADSVYTFCGSHVPRLQRGGYFKKTRLNECFSSTKNNVYNIVLQSIQTAFNFGRIVTFFFLLKLKQINDTILTNLEQKSYSYVLPRRFLILIGTFLDKTAARVQPDDRSMANFHTGRLSRFYPDSEVLKTRRNVSSERWASKNKGAVLLRQPLGTQTSNADKFDLEDLHSRLAADDFPASSNDAHEEGLPMERFENSDLATDDLENDEDREAVRVAERNSDVEEIGTD